jgi:hypothetical protein
MAENSERAKFSLADGRIEIEGSESFVAAQLVKLEPLLKAMFEHRPPPPPPGSQNSESATNKSDGSFDNYLNLFALADGKVQILKTLPGSGKATKTMNAALLLTFANDLIGTKSTAIEEIRGVCSSHACYDAPNFAKSFKNAHGKESFTISGLGGSQTVSLTHPGKTKAKLLADSLNK